MGIHDTYMYDRYMFDTNQNNIIPIGIIRIRNGRVETCHLFISHARCNVEQVHISKPSSM